MHLTNIADDVHYAVVVGEPRSDKAAAVKAPAQPRPTAAAGEPKAGPKYAALISAIAREQQVQPGLVHAIVSVESRYNANAVSPKNAAGLMQLMPATASRYGVRDRFDPSENLRAGASYLRDLLHRFNNDLPLALAAYNAGENSVIRYGNRIPPFPETQMYVPQVLDLFRNYVEQPSDAVSSPVLR